MLRDAAATSSSSQGSLARVEVLVASQLQDRLGPSERGVCFDYGDGILVLRGRLGSYYQKQLAQEAVRHLPDVRRVVNRIEVPASGL